MWEQRFIETNRGTFELFEKGEGEPLAITHFYMAFNEKGIGLQILSRSIIKCI